LTLDSTYFLTGVDVQSLDSRGTIVVVGDSMTGSGATKWPALLAKRLADAGKNYGVMNAAVGGNRILVDSRLPYGGPSAIRRFDTDVLEQPAVRYVIVFEGINDITASRASGMDPPEPASTVDVIAGIRKLTTLAHQRGIKLYATTLAPTKGRTSVYSLENDIVRRQVNEWIRSSKDIDGYFDFGRVLADPAHPTSMNPKLDIDPPTSGHPNDAGQMALAKAIDLSRFE
jgi:lysophospholipase L1-like esterase